MQMDALPAAAAAPRSFLKGDAPRIKKGRGEIVQAPKSLQGKSFQTYRFAMVRQ
jgi:hypothetical protein